MKISGNEIKPGMLLEHKNDLWEVLKTQHTQPGKGGAYLQVEMKEIREGTKMNERFRSSESVEAKFKRLRGFPEAGFSTASIKSCLNPFS